jgi:hypothetical protein
MRTEDFKKLGEMLVQATPERPLQYNLGSAADPRWCDSYTGLEYILPIEFYRLKPVAKLRAWRPEEVPVGAQCRAKCEGARWLILAAVDYAIFYGASGSHRSAEDFLRLHEHSTDGGKTWLPCGVIETETT